MKTAVLHSITQEDTFMYQINNFTNNKNIRILDQKGAFTVVEYQRSEEHTSELQSQR